MALTLTDRWLWDFWFAVDGADVHVFYLQAPRALGDPDLRHQHATIGHAVSRDLHRWHVLPDALGPGPLGAFDDLATWTGSVVRAGERWHMFYTGVSRAEHGAVQRVGRASSPDLLTWTRHGPVLEADPRWYEKLHGAVREEAWRDPWVWWDEPTDRFHMLLTARADRGPLDGRGVIGHATSADLEHWEAGPPVSSPGEFFHLEVPQLVHLGGLWRVLYCVTAGEHSAARLSRPGVIAHGGTHYLVAEDRLGPYRLETDEFLVGDERARHYAGRMLEHDGRWHFFAWENLDDAGAFVGALSDPMPVLVSPDGTLRVGTPARGR
ncbi:glycosyl hydrolase family 32 [Georgenia sp. AZ-5]|uniref:glycosyl hydrolase family 32 n=1 Tax=Georgenia sp. AZ-5 TaxID=3367526 RepID=UPI003754098A